MIYNNLFQHPCTVRTWKKPKSTSSKSIVLQRIVMQMSHLQFQSLLIFAFVLHVSVWLEVEFSMCLSHLSHLCCLLFLFYIFLSDRLELIPIVLRNTSEFLRKLLNINATFRDHASHFLKTTLYAPF